jgi:hypothetical protein
LMLIENPLNTHLPWRRVPGKGTKYTKEGALKP